MTAAAISPATRTAYDTAWALFRDWCTASDSESLPASGGTVLAFLADVPASAATLTRRAAAIDWAHRRAGLTAPSTDPLVRAALRRLTGRPPTPDRADPRPREVIDAAYRALPTHGWPAGLFGRRDRCLVTLSAVARIPVRHIRGLRASVVTSNPDDGSLDVRVRDRPVHVEPADDPTVCPTCAYAGWIRALAIAEDAPSHRVLRGALHRAPPLTADSPHICRSASLSGRRPTPAGPLLVSIDRHGYPRLGRPMSSRRIAEIVRDCADGAPRVHLTVATIPGRFIEQPDTQPVQSAVPVARPDPTTLSEGYAAALERRRRDQGILSGLDAVLAELDRRTDALAGSLGDLVTRDRPRVD